jgi:predicted ATPase/class 3 adenylate cyclase
VHDASVVKALLFTDIEGSTRLWAKEPERMRDALARHDALLRAAVESNLGAVLKSTGDGIYAAFDDPLNGLQATLAIQRALADPAATSGIPLRVRCALHVGAVEHREGDYFGTAVNQAARIMGAAHGGQVLLSQSAADLLTDRFPPGVTLSDLGLIRLRGLATPARAYQVVHRDLRRDFPPLRSLEAIPHNLPQQVTSFIGRERELAQACALLGGARLVTIVGPGGIGKTRLSLQIAADLLDAFPDGAWFVELASIVDAALVPTAVAQVLGLQETADTSVVQTVCEHLASRRLLVILDNCEHLVDGCAVLVDAMLHAAHDVRMLVSSREPLNVAGEQTYLLPPLALPGPKSHVEEAARSDAGRLFVERARLRQPEFALSERNVSSVAQICARLDGIPLALELAAARVGVLSVETICERLDDRFRLLTGGARSALPRQQTLRALIDWSYDLLGAGEKTLFDRLSVFVGGWTLPAAEAVCADQAFAQDDVLELLVSLAHKSLVVPDGNGARFRMLETIREYARDCLDRRDKNRSVRMRHRDYFLALAEQAEPYLEGGQEQPDWMLRLDVEHDNLRAALGFSIEGSDDDEAGLRLCGALYRFWAHRGHAREGRQWCIAALAHAANRPGTSSHQKALHASGTLAWRLGDITVARSQLEHALALSRELGDRVGEGRALSNLGGVAIHQADDVGAQAFLEQAVAIHQATGNRGMEARVLNNVAALAVTRGRLLEAQSAAERSLALSRELDNPMEEATSLSHLGFLAQHRGEFAQARALHERALGTAREFGVREFELELVRHLGEIALAQGDLTLARAHFRSALATSKEIGNQHEIVLCLEAVAVLMARDGSYEKAAHLCGAADALRHTIATPRTHDTREQYDATVATCREALGEGAAAAAVAAGLVSTSEQSIADAFAWVGNPAG